MAYNGSPEIKPGLSNEYDLGDYTFSVTSAYDSQRNKTDIMAYCGLSEEEISKSAVKTIYVDGNATVDSWRVEVNEYEASVYAHILSEGPTVSSIPMIRGMYCGANVFGGNTYISSNPSVTVLNGTCKIARIIQNGYLSILSVSSERHSKFWFTYQPDGISGFGGGSLYQESKKDGKTAYYLHNISSVPEERSIALLSAIPVTNIGNESISKVAWEMLYGPQEPFDGEKLVAKFPIEIGPAGGGPGGGWDIPGDTGDPSYTLHVTVNGASSGTHDDTYNAADNESVKSYGFGGDGGYGGGGGAGASTTIINEFATDKAGYVDQRAYAQSPGLGGMGGKGGKGGDGCILIFY